MNWAAYRAWWGEYLIELQWGFMRGLNPGVGVGGVTAAGTNVAASVQDAQTLMLIGWVGMVTTAFFNGLTVAGMWVRENKIPNPFKKPEA